MNYKLTTFANYSGNSKTAETSKTLKYGDLEIKLINDVYYFVHDNGATIDNINLIKMIKLQRFNVNISAIHHFRFNKLCSDNEFIH